MSPAVWMYSKRSVKMKPSPNISSGIPLPSDDRSRSLPLSAGMPWWLNSAGTAVGYHCADLWAYPVLCVLYPAIRDPSHAPLTTQNTEKNSFDENPPKWTHREKASCYTERSAPVISSIISQRDRSCVRENFIETRGIHIHNAFLYREKVTVK